MIEIKNVSYSYENAVTDGALKNVSLCIPQGQTVLLCGESGSGRSCDDLCRNNGKDLKNSCNSIFDHGNHSISARWKFILYDELCLGKTVAFILFIWAKNIADRSGGCGRDHDSIFCLRNLCIRMEILQKRDMSNLRIKPTDFA